MHDHNNIEATRNGQVVLPRRVLNFRPRPHREASAKVVRPAEGHSDAATSMYSNGTYLAAHPTWHAEDSPWKARQIVHMLSKHRLQPRSVAEVGCGAGEILLQLSNEFPDASFRGFDISEHAIALARPKETQRVKFFHSDVCQSARSFDVLLTMDVIEHVEDCFGFLRGIRNKAEYKLFHIPLDMSVSLLVRGRITQLRQSVGHLHYFTKATALALLRETGYEIIDYFYTPEYELASSDPAHRLMSGVRRFGMQVAPDMTSLLLGGCPVLVLAK